MTDPPPPQPRRSSLEKPSFPPPPPPMAHTETPPKSPRPTRTPTVVGPPPNPSTVRNNSRSTLTPDAAAVFAASPAPAPSPAPAAPEVLVTPPNLFWTRALYDFVSPNVSVDLSFREGDILAVMSVSGSSTFWWQARLLTSSETPGVFDVLEGQIPSNYVSVLPQYGSASLAAPHSYIVPPSGPDAVVSPSSFAEDVGGGVLVERHESSPEAVKLSFRVVKESVTSSSSSSSSSAAGTDDSNNNEESPPARPKTGGRLGGDRGLGSGALEGKLWKLVKTISQISIFARELSRVFPEAGLPQDVVVGSQWHHLLASLHAFNSGKTPATAGSFLSNVTLNPPLNAMLYAWLLPAVAPSGTDLPPTPTSNPSLGGAGFSVSSSGEVFAPSSSSSGLRLGAGGGNRSSVTGAIPGNRASVVARPAASVALRNIGTECLVLFAWSGSTANGELTDLHIGDRIVLVHEQGGWGFCRRNPESSDCGYVPIQYLRKVGDRGAGGTTFGSSSSSSSGQRQAPSLPTRMLTGKSPNEKKGDSADSDDPAARARAVANMPTKQFALRTTQGFDELINTGLTVEKVPPPAAAAAADASLPSPETTTPPQQQQQQPIGAGDKVTIHCRGFKWEPYQCTSRLFASTHAADSGLANDEVLSFQVGRDQVATALDLGIQRLSVGDSAFIVGSPAMCYGAAGLPGLVNSQTFVIFEVSVIASSPPAPGSTPQASGPEAFVTPRVADRVMPGKDGSRRMLPEPHPAEQDENFTAKRDRTSTKDLLEAVVFSGEIVGGESTAVGVEAAVAVVATPVFGPLGAQTNASPPPLVIETTADGLDRRPSLGRIVHAPTGASMPTSPSDQVMSPVSKALSMGKKGGPQMRPPVPTKPAPKPADDDDSPLAI